MSCTKCGAKLAGDAKFCARCGTQVLAGSSAGVESRPALAENPRESGENNVGGAAAAKKFDSNNIGWKTVVAVLGTIVGFFMLAAIMGSRDQAASGAQNAPSAAAVAPSQSTTASVQTSPSIVGTWWCRNDGNYIHQEDYDGDGSLRFYESATAQGVHATGLRLEYRGTYKLDGDVLRYTTTSVSYGSSSSGAVKVVESTKDSLVKYFQDLNENERCFKSIE